MRKKKTEIAAPKAAQAPAPSSESSPLDVDSIRELASIVESHGLSELRLTLRGGVLLLRRGERGPSVVHSTMPIQHAPPQMMQMMPASQSIPPVAAPAADQTGPAPAAQSTSPMGAAAPNGQVHYVNSPFVGTFYRSPSPEAPSFVEVGQRVKKGQVLCIVEAMKLMNEIEAEVEGTVVACLAENAKAVEYGQTLFKISP